MQPSSCLLPVCILSLLTYIFLLWHVVGNAVIWLLITVQRGHMKLISKSASTSSPRRSTQSTLPSIVLFRPMRTRACSIQIMKQFLPEQAKKTSLSSDSLSLSLSMPLSLVLLCFTSLYVSALYSQWGPVVFIIPVALDKQQSFSKHWESTCNCVQTYSFRCWQYR